MSAPIKKIVVSKEDAVFWMDKDGFWNNKHGKFEHPKIIKYFHTSIQKDEDGYHVYQKHDDFEEKVYFPYEDTALFVFDVIKGEPPVLVLNTKARMPLSPEQLYTKDDQLYIETDEDRIKFSERALIKLSAMMEDKGDQLILKMKSGSFTIRQL